MLESQYVETAIEIIVFSLNTLTFKRIWIMIYIRNFIHHIRPTIDLFSRVMLFECIRIYFEMRPSKHRDKQA